MKIDHRILIISSYYINIKKIEVYSLQIYWNNIVSTIII